MSPRTTVVIPCFNEEHRLSASEMHQFLAETRGTRLLFVDDGSTDGTRPLLQGLVRQHPRRISLLALDDNRGKAEAVRQGMLRALHEEGREGDIAGYWDADLSAPLSLVQNLAAVLADRPDVWMVLGSRVRMLGRDVRRSPLRHYAGRMFATAASWVVGLAVYDTQCGAKLFRNRAEVRGLFAEPFVARWIFDVELLARASHQRAATGADLERVIVEYPLERWHAKGGSKLRRTDFVRAAADLARIRARYFM